MRQFDVRNDGSELLFEPPIAGLRILLLPGLVVFAAENDHVMVSVRLDSKELVGVRRVPPKCVGHDTAGDTSGDHVARVQRQLRLEQGGARDAAEAHQRVVRRDDDVLAGYGMSVGLDCAGVVAELVGFGVLVDLAPKRYERLRHSGEILTRLDTGLIRKAHARPVEQRHRFEVLRIKAQLTR